MVDPFLRPQRLGLWLSLLVSVASCAPGQVVGALGASAPAGEQGSSPAPGAAGTDPATVPTAAAPADPTGSAPHTVDDAIVDAQGKVVHLHGINWFGFNNGKTMLEGAETTDPLGGDFATVVLRLRALGFNAVRLPFSFKDLALPATPYAHSCTLPTTAAVAQSVAAGGSAPALKALTAPPARTAGMCNDYLPSSSTRARFIYVVQFFIHNGFYVLIDNHLREDDTVLTAGKDAWVSGWQALLRDLTAKDATIAPHLLVDVLNEPDNNGIAWAAQGGKPGLSDLYLAAIDGMQAIAPCLFVVEGTGQSGINANWGDGFATDPALLALGGMSDPSPFFSALAARPYVRRVVISPHVYGPLVTTNFVDASGAGLFGRMSKSFGHITKSGACVAGVCTRYPVALGEFGSTFKDPRDVTALNDIATYFSNKAPANDGLHNAIDNWFYWGWSPNSGDTGGLVQNDYVTLEANKVAYLRTMGL